MNTSAPPKIPTPPASRRATRRGLALLVALAMAMTVLIGGTIAAQAKPRDDKAAAKSATPSALSGPVTGTLQDGSGAVDGVFNVTRFAFRGGKLMAIGKFTGTVTDADGKVRAGSQRIAMPVSTEPGTAGENRLAPDAPAAAAALSCEILDLVLGPLDLNLLGLEVHLDTVHLNITAVGGETCSATCCVRWPACWMVPPA